MDPKHGLIAPSVSDLKAEAAFKDWVRRFVKGAAALKAFEAGEIDAVLDPETASTILLSGANVALPVSSNVILGALDALPGEVCVIDSTGNVVRTNRAWRRFAGVQDGTGLGVYEGANFFSACQNTDVDERVYANAVAAGLRQVLNGSRDLFRCNYVCSPAAGDYAFTLTIARVADAGSAHAVITRENVSEHKHAIAARDTRRAKLRRNGAIARAADSNILLAALPRREMNRLLAEAKSVKLTYGDVIFEPDEQMRFVYFPIDSIVSLLTIVEGHQALEVGLIGREGMIGSRVALGNSASSTRALVQGTGTALRIRAARFRQAFRSSPIFQKVVLHFIDSLMVQVAQTAACNCYHSAEARLARWLLMTRERSRSDEFQLTQDFIADMLGVRRVTVTLAAGALRLRKLIQCHRGMITILDQRGLEGASCICYRQVAPRVL